MDNQEKPSKTKRKTDMLCLQKLGESLVSLSAAQLVKIPIPDNLLQAIYCAQSIKSHGAKKRQFQYIGKLMRQVDSELIQIALQNIRNKHVANTLNFQHIEKLRDQLILDGDKALQNFIELHPKANRQYLRQLIRRAHHDRKCHKKTGGEIELFKYLREIVF